MIHSIGKWIYAGLAAIAKRIRALFGFLWGLLSQYVTWMISCTVAFWSWIWDLVSDKFGDAVRSVSSAIGNYLELPSNSGISWLVDGPAGYFLNLAAFSEAVHLLSMVFAFWLLCRGARFLMLPIRALLEVL